MSNNILLLWRRNSCFDPDPNKIAEKLQKRFAPLFRKPLATEIRQNVAASMVFLEQPMRDWTPPFFEGDAAEWALATDYPLEAGAMMDQRGKTSSAGGMLTSFCDMLIDAPKSTLNCAAPPFGLVWSPHSTDEIFVQNDGLGLAQMFEYQNDGLWVLTNRVFALQALEIELKPVPEEWAARWALDHFPMNLTGYESLRFVDPGSRFRLSDKGFKRERFDVLSNWVAPDGLCHSDCAELVCNSVTNLVKAVMPFYRKATVLLSGGWDSRAVLASLRAAGADFTAQVSGLPNDPDVIVASELARIANIELAAGHAGAMPPVDMEECRRTMLLSLLWEAGFRLTRKHKHFLRPGRHLGRGRVKFTGKHGEIGRAYYSKNLDTDLKGPALEKEFIRRLTRRIPRSIKKNLRAGIEELIVAAFRQADQYDLEGLKRVDFFYLYERTRRCQSGSHSAKTGLIITPFLNPDYIRASFVYPSHEQVCNPFHQYIIRSKAPDWMTVPFAGDAEGIKLMFQEKQTDGNLVLEDDSVMAWKNPIKGKKYDNRVYWQMTGRPLVEDCLKRGGFWTDVFDPDLASEHWESAPDELVVTALLPDALQSDFE